MESKGLKVNLETTKVMVCGSEGKVIQSRIDPCGICGKSATINSALRTKCNQWIHERCSKLKKVTQSVARFFVCYKCNKVTNGPHVQQEVMSNEVETINNFAILAID